MALTGRRDEWIVRAAAVAGLATVGLVYLLWDVRMGGRAVGLASGLALTRWFFISEAAPGGQRRPARPVHHAGPLRRLAAAARRAQEPGVRRRAR